jgi:ArsR family transcriptional regulator
MLAGMGRRLERDDLPMALRAFEALSDETRFRLASMLAGQALSVSDLADELDASQPLISFHLRKLRDAGLVRARPAGKRVYYSLNRHVIERLERMLGRMLPDDFRS